MQSPCTDPMLCETEPTCTLTKFSLTLCLLLDYTGIIACMCARACLVLLISGPNQQPLATKDLVVTPPTLHSVPDHDRGLVEPQRWLRSEGKLGPGLFQAPSISSLTAGRSLTLSTLSRHRDIWISAACEVDPRAYPPRWAGGSSFPSTTRMRTISKGAPHTMQGHQVCTGKTPFKS